MQHSTSSYNRDYLSFNPLLRYILCLLDAKQVLRCMRVNKQFYNTILNNWGGMQKMLQDLSIDIDKYRGSVSIYSNGDIWNADGGTYRFHIGHAKCEVNIDHRIQPVLNFFHIEAEKGRTVEIRSQHQRTNKEEVTKPKKGVKQPLDSLLAQVKLEGTQTSNTCEQSSFFDASFSVSSASEGLEIVLNFLLSRCNLHSLDLWRGTRDPLPEKYLNIIRDCVRNTGVKLLSPITVHQFSATLTNILRQLDTKEIKVRAGAALCDSILLLPVESCRVSFHFDTTILVSLSPIALLTQEWQQGRRSIQSVKFTIVNSTFTVLQIKQMLNNFSRTTIVSSSDADIKSVTERACDSKVLLITYGPVNHKLWEAPGDVITIREADAKIVR